MCFVDEPEPEKPAAPPQVLQQATPDKKTAVTKKRSNALAIGTKKYRSDTGIGTPGLGIKNSPTGIAL